ncbi:helix-turn-helix domain-containing protein [Macrococcus sp. DPC7161]|uniref:helix-turn-helix domain-containing protein n=1 Tax=Macrococcus sp. DPC7161 TaxID=2507060 RepID=UPI00100A83FF|nr:helix-turn-helix domain-containing protein [Macrococcus sp. DPC7161]RXK17240.1 XRE family transcriptional regulator [Macrococcus sp. DPC7161]
MDLGTRIRQRRKELNLTQAQLAHGICTQSQVSKIEKNEMVPLSNLLIKMAKKLKISIDELVGNPYEQTSYMINKNDIDQLLLLRQYQELADYLAVINYSKLTIEDRVYVAYLKLIITAALNGDNVLDQILKLYKEYEENISDALKVNMLNSIGNYYVDSDEDKALEYYEDARRLIYDNHLNAKLEFKVIYNYLRLLMKKDRLIEAHEMAQEAIELSYRHMDVLSLPEFIYVKNTALKHMDHQALINKEELTFAIHLARKQRKLEMIQLLSEI